MTLPKYIYRTSLPPHHHEWKTPKDAEKAGKQYQPVPELGNNKKLKPYFPDGTKCHVDKGGKMFYCRDQGHDSEKVSLTSS